MKKQTYSTAKPQEKAILVGLITLTQTEPKAVEYLEELDFLARTANALVVKHFTQRVEKPDGRTFVGKGKLDEIAFFIAENEIDIAIFDDELTPTQLRNIEEVAKCKVLDRTNLILDIFASRARTAYSRTQVELAQYEYMLPRLTRMWTHLQKQRGGIGMKGPGEKEIETDRRIIRQRISLLKEDLKNIDKQKQTQRKQREKLIRVSLVGYTNVGKSTLMNLVSKSDVFAENKLFATLDTTVRKVTYNNLAFLLSDTVGFIRKLPTHLIESFKSTLDEIKESDILLHIVDVSHHNYEEQMDTVIKTLEDIGVGNKQIITVFNKIDMYKGEDDFLNENEGKTSLQILEESVIGHIENASVFISAKKGTNIEKLKEIIFKEVKKIHTSKYPGTMPFYS